MKKKRVTQVEIAQAAGVTKATVSMALRNHQSISDATRKRVKRVADELGYIADPVFSSLASYRTRSASGTFLESLAWVVRRGFDWKGITTYRRYFEGARTRAKECGFKFALLELPQTTVNNKEFMLEVDALKIQGMLFCPQPEIHARLQLPWSKLSAVTFGYTLEKPRLHAVTTNQFSSILQTVSRMNELGYRRIAFGISDISNERINRSYLGAYLAKQFTMKEDFLVPFLRKDASDPKAFRSWFLKHRPDALLTDRLDILDFLQKAGLKIPMDLGVACPSLPSSKTPLAGIYEDPRYLGEIAVDVLVSMIQRRETGIPEFPQRVHVDGLWMPGRTLPRKKK